MEMPTLEGETHYDSSQRTLSRQNQNEENKPAQSLSRKKQLKQLALQEDKEAQYALGVMFRDGNDVLKDSTKAVKWLDLSACLLYTSRCV